uniref:Uncharacterized protein n=1 Tax=Leptobrachium leishanense TaxID=445787 RepID=A0A8C5QJ32_9ANUR
MELSSAGHENSPAKLENSAGNSVRDTTDDGQDALPYDGVLECYLTPNADHHELSSSDVKHSSIGTADHVSMEPLVAAGHDLNNSVNLENSGGVLAKDGTDDEQEDLPYDGILECYLIPNTEQHELDKPAEHSGGQQTFTNVKGVEEAKDQIECASFSAEETDTFSFSESTSKYMNNENTGQVKNDTVQSKSRTMIIPDVLQRHFSDDGMIGSFQFIDTETIPEISIAESSEDIFTMQTWKRFTRCDSENEKEDDLENSLLTTEGNVNQEVNVPGDRNSGEHDVFTESDGEETSPRHPEECRLQDDIMPCGNDEKSPNNKYDIERRSSYSDIKYGQGQVHYKLPDFSKVQPKVKIPKGNGHIKTFPTMNRTRSSPNLTGSSIVIRDILDSMQPYTEPEHLEELCHMSGGLQSQVLVDDVPLTAADGSFIESSPTVKIQATHIDERFPGANLQGNNLLGLEPSQMSANGVPVQRATEGEKMSAMLNDQALQLKVKLFQNLKSCLESLELNYLATKEKHRNLQLQVYRTDSQEVGEFDIERQVAGQIFKLGMLLEDIQEQINERERSQSPPVIPEINQHDTASTLYTKEMEDVFAPPAVHSTDNTTVDSRQKEEALSFRMELKSPVIMTSPERGIYKQDTSHQERTTDYTDEESIRSSSKIHYGLRLPDTSPQMLEPEFRSEAIRPCSNHLPGKNLALKLTDHHEDAHSIRINEPVLSDHFLFEKTITEWNLTENTREMTHQTQRRSSQEKGQNDWPLNSRYETFRAGKMETRLSNNERRPFLTNEKMVDFPDCK